MIPGPWSYNTVRDDAGNYTLLRKGEPAYTLTACVPGYRDPLGDVITIVTALNYLDTTRRVVRQ